MLSLIFEIRSKALEGEKEKLVFLVTVRGYLCHSNPKHVIFIIEFHLPFPFLQYKVESMPLAIILNCYLLVILKDVFDLRC